MNHPEALSRADQHYDRDEAARYSRLSRIRKIQTDLAVRAFELLSFQAQEPPRLLLDIGCGSGLGGKVLTAAGVEWIGVDIAPAMLAEAQMEEDVDGDLIRHDIGQRAPFRAGSFDGAVSISVIQWLCYAHNNQQNPRHRLLTFFRWLAFVLRRGSKAVLQFYPNHPEQVKLIKDAALKAGFDGGIVLDNAESKKQKKYFLVISAGGFQTTYAQAALVEAEANLQAEEKENQTPSAPCVSKVTSTENVRSFKKVKKDAKTRSSRKQKVQMLKQKQLKRGMDVRPESKYSGRKRKSKF